MSTLDLQGFHPKMKDLIGVAIDLGWTARQDPRPSNKRGPITLRSHDGQQTVLATPVRQVNDAKLATMRRKIVKYADPVRRLQMVAKIEWAEMTNHRDETPGFAPTAIEARTTDHVEVAPPTVTSVRPWLARKASSKRGGTGYESAAVIEQVWSDGSVVYLCAFPGCPYEHARARSVANHYGAAHTQKGEVPPAPQDKRHPMADYFEPLTHREYHPSERLIAALTDFLTKHTEQGASFEELATAMLQWSHERPDLPDIEPQARAVLGPEDILEKIRELVGAPLASRLLEAQEEAHRLATALEAAEEGRRTAEGRWTALKAIVDQEDA